MIAVKGKEQMKLLTKNTDYAVRALIELARHEEGYLSSRLIAKSQKLPYQFLRAIVSELIKHKLVLAKEGARGGLKLNKSPERIKIIDVIRIFQGDVELSDCLFQKKICANRATCVLRAEIKRIESIVSREFGKRTISSMLKK